MSLITRMRKHKAAWWKRLEADEFGQFRFDDPEEIECRWEERAVEYLGPGDEKQVSKAVVYVDRVIAQGDRLKLGAITYQTPQDPLTLSDAHEVQRVEVLPNLKATESLITVFL